MNVPHPALPALPENPAVAEFVTAVLDDPFALPTVPSSVTSAVLAHQVNEYLGRINLTHEDRVAAARAEDTDYNAPLAEHHSEVVVRVRAHDALLYALQVATDSNEESLSPAGVPGGGGDATTRTRGLWCTLASVSDPLHHDDPALDTVCEHCAPYIVGGADAEDLPAVMGDDTAARVRTYLEQVGMAVPEREEYVGTWYECPVCEQTTLGQSWVIRRGEPATQ